MKDNNKKILRGTAIYAIGNLGTKIITFLFVPLYTYYISPEEMGDYDLLLTTVALLTPLITLRVSDAAYRWMLHRIEPERNCISATYRVIAASTLLSAVLILGINAIFHISYAYYFVLLLVLGRWLESLQTLLRGMQKQKLFALSGLLYTLIYVILNIIKVVGLHQGAVALLQSTIISELITILVILLSTKELRTWIIRTPDNRKLTMDMLRYSAPLVPSGLSWWIMGASDRYVIRWFLGRAATGIFSVANKFPSLMSMLFTIFNYAWTDVAIADLDEGDETSEYSSAVFEKLYIVAFSFCFALIPVTKVFTTTILSESYKEASIYIGFLYLGSIFQGFTAFISAGLLQGTDTRSIGRSSFIGAIVNLSVDLVAVKFIGLHAASISTFMGFFVMWLIRMKDVQKVAPLKYNKVLFWALFGGGILIALISIYSNLMVDLALSLLFGIAFVYINRRIILMMLKKF